MRKTLIAYVALSMAAILVTSCTKENETPTPSNPSPSSTAKMFPGYPEACDGVMTVIRADDEGSRFIDYHAFFGNIPVSDSVGELAANDIDLDYFSFDDTTVYVGYDNEAISDKSVTLWTSTGTAKYAAFSYEDKGNYPSFSMTSPDTIYANQALTISTTISTGTDVVVRLYNPFSGGEVLEVRKMVAIGQQSVVFSAAEVNSLIGDDPELIVDISGDLNHLETIGSKKYYFVKYYQQTKHLIVAD